VVSGTLPSHELLDAPAADRLAHVMSPLPPIHTLS